MVDEIKRDTHSTDMIPKVPRSTTLGRDCLPPPPSVPTGILQTLDWSARALELVDDMMGKAYDTLDPTTMKSLCNQVTIHKQRVDALQRCLEALIEDLEENEAQTRKMGTIDDVR